MQQCVEILGNMAESSNPYNNFQKFNHHNALLNLQNQGQYYRVNITRKVPIKIDYENMNINRN